MRVLSLRSCINELRSMIDSRIQLADALNMMDEKVLKGKSHAFSLEWVSSSGEKIRLEEAAKCGLRADVDRNRFIGIRSVNNNHHPHTVDIHTITVFNGKRIYW